MPNRAAITMAERDEIFAALEHETATQVAATFSRHPRTIGQLRTLRLRMGLAVAQSLSRQEAYLRAAVKRSHAQSPRP